MLMQRQSEWVFPGLSRGYQAGKNRECNHAGVAQQAERVLGKDEVTSSNLVISSIEKDFPFGKSFSIMLVKADSIKRGPQNDKSFWGEEVSRHEPEDGFAQEASSANTANDDEVISSKKEPISDRGKLPLFSYLIQVFFLGG